MSTTGSDSLPATRPRRTVVPARFLMCRPEHVEVTYAVNAWLRPELPTSQEVAVRQWTALRSTLEELGHEVELIDAVAGLPDMVFAANGALIHGDRAVVARPRHPERHLEATWYEAWLTGAGFDVHHCEHSFEGAGDVTVVPGRDLAIAGYGLRTDRAAHAQLARCLGLDVLSVELVDERFCHLDAALSPLDERTALYAPDAFTAEGVALITSVFPEAFPVPHNEAKRLAAAAISDGWSVLVPHEARTTAGWLRSRGFRPVPLPVTELRRSGGGLRCCVLRLGSPVRDRLNQR
ncbi:MAG: hypothetical protein R2761_26300 [Acidimicrobiales bacterium]